MNTNDFMYPADALMDSLNALMQAHTPVLTATGKLIRPRLVLMGGETGSGKTTIPKMLSKAEGTPLVRINPWRRMQATKLTVSLSIGKTVQMSVADFLLACGKINGKRVSAAYPTSNRVRILIDEANVTRDVWYVLDAIARGEKKFKVETPAGDAVEVELDAEVEIVLTYNPPERYGGTGRGSNRFQFPQPLGRKAVKIYTSEPLEDYSDDEIKEIMKEVYRRGEVHFERLEALEELESFGAGETEEQKGFFAVEDEYFEVQRVQEPAAKKIEELTREIAEAFPPREKIKKIDLSPEKIEQLREKHKEQLSFDSRKLEEVLINFEREKSELDPHKRFLLFMSTVMPHTLVGMAREAIEQELFEAVVGSARTLHPELAKLLGDFSEVCHAEKTSLRKLRAF